MNNKSIIDKKVVVHIPHSSLVIPSYFRKHFVLSDAEIYRELLCMTDRYTDELFNEQHCVPVIYKISRLVCDVERFLDIEQETMIQQGMGMYYTKTSNGAVMKHCPFESLSGVDAYKKALVLYKKHHKRFCSVVDTQIEQFGKAVIVDGHSFSSSALPYEMKIGDAYKVRPHICIGTDDIFTPAELSLFAKEYFEQQGLTVAFNKPYNGTITPIPYYNNKDTRVQSIMIEINRKLYMNEQIGEKNENFDKMQKIIREFLYNVYLLFVK